MRSSSNLTLYFSFVGFIPRTSFTNSALIYRADHTTVSGKADTYRKNMTRYGAPAFVKVP
jgi:hypothetical protein